MLRRLRARLARLARTAEDFRDLAGEVWAPRVGAYLNAAHWLQHSLQEPAGPLLLLDLEGACVPLERRPPPPLEPACLAHMARGSNPVDGQSTGKLEGSGYGFCF